MKSKTIYIPAYVRAAEKGFAPDQKEFDFVITTEKRDSYDTVFESDGWDFTRYAENPIVCYQHRSGSDDPDNLIGITVKGPWAETLSDGTKAHVARVRFEEEEVNPKAEKIRKKIIAGTLRMASIGAHIHEYRMGKLEEDKDVVYFTRQELLEWSIVNIGSNAGALLQRNAEALEEIKKDILPKQEEKPEQRNGLSVRAARLELYKSKIAE